MTDKNEYPIDVAEISEEIIITNIIKSRRKELIEKFEKNKKKDDYHKTSKEFIKDVYKEYRKKIDKFFSNIKFDKKKFMKENGDYYYPELVALVLDAYLRKSFSNKQLRSLFQNKQYDLIKYTERNQIFLEIYEILIKKYEKTEQAELLKNEAAVLKAQYDEYEEFYNEINNRITVFGEKMKKLVKEVIPQKTGIMGIKEAVFIPELQWMMDDPTIETIRDIAPVRDIDTYKAFVCRNDKREDMLSYLPRAYLFRDDVRIIMSALERLFDNALAEWETVFVEDYKKQRIIELECEYKKNSKYEDLETDDYFTTYYDIDRESMLTPDEMGEFVLMRTYFKRKSEEIYPDVLGGLLNHPEFDQENMLNVIFKGLDITEQNDPDGIIQNLKNILNLDPGMVQLLKNQIDEFIGYEDGLDSESPFGKAIYAILEHRRLGNVMDVTDLINFFSAILCMEYSDME